MTRTHTPTPWRIRDCGNTEIIGANGRTVETLPGASYNAAHIVRCVNAHDELVAALRKAERVLNHIGAASGSEHIGAWEAVRDAIAKVAP